MPDNRGHIITEHTEEAQQILGRIPSWIVRWGVTVIFAVFALILIGCCIIKYPERVTATVTITTGNSPVDVVAGAAAIWSGYSSPAEIPSAPRASSESSAQAPAGRTCWRWNDV